MNNNQERTDASPGLLPAPGRPYPSGPLPRTRGKLLRLPILQLMLVAALAFVLFAVVTKSFPLQGKLNGYVVNNLDPCGTWNIVPADALGGRAITIEDVAAVSQNDVWFVGDNYSSRPSFSASFFHWDGHSVTRFPDIDPQAEDITIGGSAVIGTNDIWVVGSATRQDRVHALTFHWDGQKWSPIDIPNLQDPSHNPAKSDQSGSPTFVSSLSEVIAFGPDNIWAVGGYGSGDLPDRMLILRWSSQQQQWVVVPGPDLAASFSDLHGLAALSADDMWAIGRQASIRGELWEWHPLVIHWDGKRWEPTNSPAGFEYLKAISVTQDGEIWALGSWGAMPPEVSLSAVGTISNGNKNGNKIEWRNVPLPEPKPRQFPEARQFDHLESLVALAHNNVWAIGPTYYDKSPNDGAAHSLVMHFDGDSWKRVDFPTPLYTQSLQRMRAVQDDIWVVGSYYDDLDDTPGYPMAVRYIPCPSR